MRTTLDLDPSVLRELRDRSKHERKSMGQLASELLAPVLAEPAGSTPQLPSLQTWRGGIPRVHLEDKDGVWRVLDAPPQEGSRQPNRQ